MPNSRRRKIRGQQNTTYGHLTDARKRFFLWGFDMMDGDYAAWQDEAEIAACWARHKENVMDWFFTKHPSHADFSRPWAWWTFEKKMKKPDDAQTEKIELIKILSTSVDA